MFLKKESQLISERTDDQALEDAFNKKFASLKLGRRVECGFHLYWLKEPIKTIKIDNQIYHISDATFFSFKEDKKLDSTISHTHAFLVEKNSKFSLIQIVSKAKQAGALYRDVMTSFIIDGKEIPLKKDSDIYDMYDLRFQLKDHKEAKQFLDDFVLVGPQKCQRYKLYETQQLYRQKRALLTQRKIQSRER